MWYRCGNSLFSSPGTWQVLDGAAWPSVEWPGLGSLGYAADQWPPGVSPLLVLGEPPLPQAMEPPALAWPGLARSGWCFAGGIPPPRR